MLTRRFLVWSLAVSLLPLLALVSSLDHAALEIGLPQLPVAAILALALLSAAIGTLLFRWLIAHPLKMLVRNAEAVAGLETANRQLQAESHERQQVAEQKLAQLMFYDTLTGLPNRILFRDRLEREMADCRRNSKKAALLFLNLDRFKYINNTLGNNIGDLLLAEVATRVKAAVRENDTVALLGGDEFAVVLGDMQDSNAAAGVAQMIIQRLSQPITLLGKETFVSASIGICLYPGDGQDFDALTRNADAAMCHAKELGRGAFRFFTEEMNLRTQGRLALESDLRRALERGEFAVVYQPQADLATGRLVGAEALLRWHHPERGMVSPLQFIPLAEENGMILPIGAWVLREVCRQIKVWRELGLTGLHFAVNLSPRQFRQENLVEDILGILGEFDVPASALELEITEGAAMENADAAIGQLNQLNRHGFSIAIDDFGTGYSSLGYLKRFPVSKLKIDRSFVMDIPGDANDTAIAIAVIQLAKSLGLKVVAEGVETDVQRQFLSDQGCDILQGYWYSKPLDAQSFEAFARGCGQSPEYGARLSAWSPYPGQTNTDKKNASPPTAQSD
ncbi:MAG: EAL domain-containing protein [Sulfuricella sp.]|nr:EAL domain-containing protein [Sulfuricella sp.]